MTINLEAKSPANMCNKTLRFLFFLWILCERSIVYGQVPTLHSGHYGKILSIAISPDGKYAVSGDDTAIMMVWDLETGYLLRKIHGHTSGVTSIAFSSDGRYIVSGSNMSVKIWDVETGQLLQTMTEEDSVLSVAFSPDGHYVASGSSNNTVKVWQARTGQLKHTMTGHSDYVLCVAFGSDGRLFSVAANNVVKVWDVKTGELQHTMTGHEDQILSAVFSPDRRYMVSGSVDMSVKIWDIATGNLLKTMKRHTNDVNYVTISPDGIHVASASINKLVIIWNLITEELITINYDFDNENSEEINCIAIGPNRKLVLGDYKNLIISILEKGDLSQKTKIIQDGNYTQPVSISTNGRYAAFCIDKSIVVWDIETGDLHNSEIVYEFSVMTPNGDSIVRTIGDKFGIDSSFGFLIENIFEISVANNGRYVAYLPLWLKSIEVLDFKTKRVPPKINGHHALVTSLAVSENGKYVVSTASVDSTMKVWDVATGNLLQKIPVTTYYFNPIAISMDEKYVALRIKDSAAGVWELETGKMLWNIKNKQMVSSIAITPDVRHVVVGLKNGTLNIHDLKTGHLRRNIKVKKEGIFISHISISSDVRYIASTLGVKELIISSFKTGHLLKKIPLNNNLLIECMSISPNGQYVILVCRDYTIKFFNLKTGQEALTIKQFSSTDWVAFTPDGRHDGSPEAINKYLYFVDKMKIYPASDFKHLYTPGLIKKVTNTDEASHSLQKSPF